MNVISPEMPWKQAQEQLWKSCSSLGEPGTKEKELNMQRAIFDEGNEVTSNENKI